MSTRGPVNEIWLKNCYGADALFTMTEFERNFFVKNNINNNVYSTGVGPVISENHADDFREKYGIEDEQIILFLGRFNKLKGIEEMLKATGPVWKRFPEAYFFFVGPIEEDAERLLKYYKDRRIVLVGPVDLHEKSAALKACDILCVPSVTESIGGVYLEAWYYGKPVIGADIPPFREITQNGKGGVMVEPSAEGIAKGILFLLENPYIRTTMGEWGKDMVRSKYSWEIIASKIEGLYLDISKRRFSK